MGDFTFRRVSHRLALGPGRGVCGPRAARAAVIEAELPGGDVGGKHEVSPGLENVQEGLVNVPIEHHPSIGDIISNRYFQGVRKWLCLKMLCTRKNPMFLLIIIPTKWLFHWGYTPFSDIPKCSQMLFTSCYHTFTIMFTIYYLTTSSTSKTSKDSKDNICRLVLGSWTNTRLAIDWSRFLWQLAPVVAASAGEGDHGDSPCLVLNYEWWQDMVGKWWLMYGYYMVNDG